MIIQNSVKCLLCEEVIWSANQHDFVTCKCGNISVDGGLAYLRRMGRGVSDRTYMDLSMTMKDEHVFDMREKVRKAIKFNKNNFGIALTVIRSLVDNGYIKHYAIDEERLEKEKTYEY